MTPGEKLAQRIIGFLRLRGDAVWGRGWKDHVNRTLEMSPNFLYQAMSRGNMRLNTLFDVLNALEMNPVGFLGDALSVDSAWSPLARLSRHALSLNPEIPPALHAIREHLDSFAEVTVGPLESEERDLVAAVEAGRFENPWAACQLAEDALVTLVGGNSPYSLAVTVPLLAGWASARRKSDDPDAALWALLLCLRTIDRAPDSAMIGDLYQRLALCYSNHFGDFAGALEITNLALAEHCAVGNSLGIAKSLVDRGIWLFRMGSYDRSLEIHRRVLEELPSQEIPNRFSCYICAANCYRALGKRANMSDAIKQAEAISDQAGRLHAISLRWLQGTIAAETRQFEVAEQALAECCDHYLTYSPVNAALVTLELVNLYIAHGQTRAAKERAQAMFRLIEPLGRYPLAEAAVARLVSQASFAEITEEVLLRTRAAILTARGPRGPRALAES